MNTGPWSSCPWWRCQMEKFSMLLSLCEGNPLVTGEFPSQSSVTWSFDVFFDWGLNKRLSKQSRCLWFQMPSCSLWCYCNATASDLNTLRFETKRPTFADSIFKCIFFLLENHWTFEFHCFLFLKGPINQPLVEVMAWSQTDKKALMKAKFL